MGIGFQGEVGNETILYPDANNGYSSEETKSVLWSVKKLGVRYFEDSYSSEHLDALVHFRMEIGRVSW